MMLQCCNDDFGQGRNSQSWDSQTKDKKRVLILVNKYQ